MGAILTPPGEGHIDHPVAFASRKLSSAERNYSTMEREGLEMVYSLQKCRHYLLEGHFKMFTDHSALNYLVNKLVSLLHLAEISTLGSDAFNQILEISPIFSIPPETVAIPTFIEKCRNTDT